MTAEERKKAEDAKKSKENKERQDRDNAHSKMIQEQNKMRALLLQELERKKMDRAKSVVQMLSS